MLTSGGAVGVSPTGISQAVLGPAGLDPEIRARCGTCARDELRLLLRDRVVDDLEHAATTNGVRRPTAASTCRPPPTPHRALRNAQDGCCPLAPSRWKRGINAARGRCFSPPRLPTSAPRCAAQRAAARRTAGRRGAPACPRLSPTVAIAAQTVRPVSTGSAGGGDTGSTSRSRGPMRAITLLPPTRARRGWVPSPPFDFVVTVAVVLVVPSSSDGSGCTDFEGAIRRCDEPIAGSMNARLDGSSHASREVPQRASAHPSRVFDGVTVPENWRSVFAGLPYFRARAGRVLRNRAVEMVSGVGGTPRDARGSRVRRHGNVHRGRGVVWGRMT